MKPPMVPYQSHEADAVNFRAMKDSASVDVGSSQWSGGSGATCGKKNDPFVGFNSVTLLHDGDGAQLSS